MSLQLVVRHLRFAIFLICAAGFAQVPIYNPGCPSDGMTDASSCFITAFGSHNTVAAGPGTFLMTQLLTLLPTQTLVGAGTTQTQIHFTCAVKTCAQGTSQAAGILFAASADPQNNLGAGLGGLQHLTVYGPAATTSTFPIGIYMGGGLSTGQNNWVGNGIHCDDIVVVGFTTGVQFGNNAYTESFTNSRFISNTTHVYAPSAIGNSGEKIVFQNAQFFLGVNAIEDLVGMEWMIDDATFDGQSGTSIIMAGTSANSAAANHLNINHSHFETNNNRLTSRGFITNNPYGTSTFGIPTISIKDTSFLVTDGADSGTSLISTTSQAVQVNIVGGYAESNAAGLYLVNSGKSVWLQSVAGNALGNLKPISDTAISPSLVTNMFGGPFKAFQ